MEYYFTKIILMHGKGKNSYIIKSISTFKLDMRVFFSCIRVYTHNIQLILSITQLIYLSIFNKTPIYHMIFAPKETYLDYVQGHTTEFLSWNHMLDI